VPCAIGHAACRIAAHGSICRSNTQLTAEAGQVVARLHAIASLLQDLFGGGVIGSVLRDKIEAQLARLMAGLFRARSVAYMTGR
jgi:hypothetical protein